MRGASFPDPRVVGDKNPVPIDADASMSRAASQTARPAKPGYQDDFKERPEVVANRVSILGKYTQLIRGLIASSESALVDELGTLIEYAKRCDLDTSKKIFEDIASLDPAAIDKYARKEVAYALLENGHRAQAIVWYGGIIADVDLFSKTPKLSTADLKLMLSHGCADLVEGYFDKLIKVSVADIDDGISRGELRSSIGAGKIRDLIESIRELEKDPVVNSNPAWSRLVVAQLDKIWESHQATFDLRRENDRDEINTVNSFEVPEGSALQPIEEPACGSFMVLQASFNSKKLASCARDTSSTVKSIYAVQTIRLALDADYSFEQGLKYIAKMPDCFDKLELIGYAAKHTPPRMSDDVRTYLEKQVKELVDRMAPSYRKMHLINPDVVERHDENVGKNQDASIPIEQTWLGYLGETIIAQLWVSSADPSNREKAYKIVDKLPGEETLLQHAVNLEDKYSYENRRMTHSPALSRVKAIVELASSAPGSEQKELLSNATVGLGGAGDQIYELTDDYACLRLSLLEEIGIQAAKAGHLDLFVEVHELAKTFPEGLKRVNTEIPEWRLERALYGATKVRTLLEIINSVNLGEPELQKSVDEINQDNNGRRHQYDPNALISSFNIIGNMKNFATFALDVKVAFAKAVIDAHLLAIGEKGSYTSNWESLVDGLKNLRLPNSASDQVFAYLIDKSTPRDGVLVGGEMKASEVRSIYSVYQALDFVLGNRDLPVAEGMLLERLEKQIGKLEFSRQDQRTLWSIRAIVSLYARLADDLIVDPANLPVLLSLRSDPLYQDRARALAGETIAAQHKRSIGEVTAEYRQLVSKKDHKALEALRPELNECIEQFAQQKKDELLAYQKKIKDERRPKTAEERRTVVILSDLSGSLLDQIQKDWASAVRTGDTVVAEALLKVLSTSNNSDQSIAKAPVVIEKLADKDVSLEVKRQLFEDFSKTTYVTPYAKKLWEALKTNDDVRESAFYLLAIPHLSKGDEIKYINQADALLALVEDSKPEDLAKLVNNYLKFRMEPSTFKFEATDITGWQIFAHHGEGVLSNSWHDKIASAMALMCYCDNPRVKPWKTYDDCHKDRGIIEYFSENSDVHLSFLDKRQHHKIEYVDVTSEALSLYRVAKALTEFPDQKTAKAVKTILAEAWANQPRVEDRITNRFVVLPEIFKDLPPLMTFVISRYMQRLPVGERQDILAKLEAAKSEGEALTKFFESAHLEKVGQFLSYWPEVPQKQREQLKKLQGDVDPSSFEEVKKTIRTELAKHAELDSILKNLDPKPLGSGTVGEVYRSKLSNGADVAIKVITESKEDNIRKSLDIIGEVQNLLELYADEIEGAQAAVRFIKMYDEMLLKELDLRNENRNYTTFNKKFPKAFVSPLQYKDMVREKILVMELLPEPVSIIDSSVPKKVAQTFMKALETHFRFQQIAKAGIFLADLQPGNILYTKKNGGTLVDFAQMGQLTESEKSIIPRMLIAYTLKQSAKMRECLEGLSTKTSTYSKANAKKLESTIKAEMQDQSEKPISLRLNAFISAAAEAGLLVNTNILLLIKAQSTLEATQASFSEVS